MLFTECLLKASIVQPSIDIETLYSRLDALDEILGSQKIYDGIRSALANLPRNIGVMLSKFGLKRLKGQKQMQRRLLAIVELKKALSSMQVIYESLVDTASGRSSVILDNVQQMCQHEVLLDVSKRIESELDDDSLAHADKGFRHLMQQVRIPCETRL